jgi:hypothetical protein
MANPWGTTPLQVALDPLYLLLRNIDGRNVQRPGRSQRDVYRSPLIMKLRAADQLIEKDRTRKFHEHTVDSHPIILKTQQLFVQLTDLYERLAGQLELINRPELLKEMIVFDRPFFVREEISQENKEKLINSIRSGTRAIITLLTNRAEEMTNYGPLEECKYHMLDVIQNMDIFNEQIDLDDYDSPDLYEFLMECCHAVDLIKKTSIKQRPLPVAIVVSASSAIAMTSKNSTCLKIATSVTQETAFDVDESSSVKSCKSFPSANATLASFNGNDRE